MNRLATFPMGEDHVLLEKFLWARINCYKVITVHEFFFSID
jgi:hypothetical protein